jgi:hypothetical protein
LPLNFYFLCFLFLGIFLFYFFGLWVLFNWARPVGRARFRFLVLLLLCLKFVLISMVCCLVFLCLLVCTIFIVFVIVVLCVSFVSFCFCLILFCLCVVAFRNALFIFSLWGAFRNAFLFFVFYFSLLRAFMNTFMVGVLRLGGFGVELFFFTCLAGCLKRMVVLGVRFLHPPR